MEEKKAIALSETYDQDIVGGGARCNCERFLFICAVSYSHDNSNGEKMFMDIFSLEKLC